MFRSLFGLLFILIGVSMIIPALNGDPTVMQSQASRTYGGYAGAALLIAGFITGKFWSLKWEPKRRISAAAPERREEPVEEQIDLFEPRNKA